MKFPLFFFLNMGMNPHIITPQLVKIVEIFALIYSQTNSFSLFIPRVCTLAQKQFSRTPGPIDISRTLYEDK